MCRFYTYKKCRQNQKNLTKLIINFILNKINVAYIILIILISKSEFFTKNHIEYKSTKTLLELHSNVIYAILQIS